MSALVMGALPALTGLVMMWAALVALAGQGDGELGARALARDPARSRLSPERTLHVMHLASLTIAAGLASTLTGWWAFPPALGALRVVLVSVLVWAVGDLVPRLLGVLAPELVPYARRVALASAPAFGPLLWIAERLDGAAADPPQAASRGGAPSPQDMALGVFSLASMNVSEVMTPRIDIVSVDVSEDEAAVTSTLRRSEHARLLVFDEHADEVVGVLYAKDILPRLRGGSETQESWQALIRPPAFVPEAKRLDRQLRDFQRGPGHIAVVVDEFGGTAGLVTLEDILEQIVGEIQDEHDVDEVQPVYRHDDGHLTVQGGVALADLEAELNHDFEREDVDTVGGLVLAALGRVPRTGEEFELDGWRVVVELVIRRRVRRVSLRRPDPVGVAVSPRLGKV
ncbi:MAG: hemolysin family protein [Gemmatimonadales bacterium]